MGSILLFAVAVFAETPKVPPDRAVVVVVRGEGECLSGVAWNDLKTFVSSLFDEIGIRLIWQRGNSPPERAAITVYFARTAPGWTKQNGPACSFPGALACSRPFDVASPTVIVMFDRARFYSRRPRLFNRLLAYTISHEMAHVIGARTTHSETGIMKEHWTADDFDRMEYSKLAFTSRDIESIHEGFAIRHW